jgi:hypothetical protein
MWRSLTHISSTLSSDLRTKRVWIDKKLNDYARPLTVPTPEWRCFSWMRMDHFEKFYRASGQLQPWQHGGRSGAGVLSCYKQLIPRLRESNTIYEFDIKGFFDNISHESIIKRFKETIGPTTAEWITNILNSKPMNYTLPPIEFDKAALSYEKMRNEKFEDDWGIHTPTYEDWGFIGIHTYEDIPAGTPVDQLHKYVLFSEMEEWDQAIAKVTKPIELGTVYKNLMHENATTRRVGNSITGEIQVLAPTEEARALGRDNWKGLGQPGKGVPQGLGTSPFISTFITDTYLYELGTEVKALIMYMDDGILFANSKVQMMAYVKRLKGLLGAIGLEIEPSKSRYAKIDGVWQGSIKFLGLRYLPDKDTFMSDTRSGTQIEFPGKNWEDIKDMAAINNLSIPYMRKTFDKLINTQAYEAGLKYGFLGCLIAGSQYKDAIPMEERKEEIRKGQASAWARVRESTGYIWKSQDLVNYAEDLTNVSSIACHRFAEFNRLGRKLYCPKRSKGKLSRKQRV